MKTTDVIAYLSGGALIEILKIHAGARGVWLRETDDGKIAHTFTGGAGRVGGRPVPIDAELFGNVKPQRIGEVQAMLRGFGLSDDTVKVVLKAVGTAPQKPANKSVEHYVSPGVPAG